MSYGEVPELVRDVELVKLRRGGWVGTDLHYCVEFRVFALVLGLFRVRYC